jgi:DNA replication ATP-dependent helicase Dna2
MPKDNSIGTDELFGRIESIIQAQLQTSNVSVNRFIHETLVLACNEAMRDRKQTFGNLFSQIDYLCREHRMTDANRYAVQSMRRMTNKVTPISSEELMYCLRALAIFISKISDTDIPEAIAQKLPKSNKEVDSRYKINERYIRCAVKGWNDQTITATYDGDTTNDIITINYTDTAPGVNLTYVKGLLREGMQLNLLDCHVENDVITPLFIVVEPDFLVDISTISACFNDYGHHPLSYTINRMKPRPNSSATLLGNLAGSMLDDIIHESKEHSYNISTTIKDNFCQKAFEYCTCKDFEPNRFKIEAINQSRNIKDAVEWLFSDDYDRNKAILEPSFVCERLGIQGRVDLMTTDCSLLVEQKSGKNHNIENNQKNDFGSYQIESHYVQVLLYYGVLQYNFGLHPNDIDIKLLYSRFPAQKGLLTMTPYRQLLREAIRFRNELVAGEFFFADKGFDKIIDRLSADTVNVKGLNSMFFNRYIRPDIENVTAPLHRISNLERSYFCRMMTFVYTEQLLQKVGGATEQSACNADLWNMPLHEKIETGNIYLKLIITNKQKSTGYNGYDIITLCVPGQGEDFLPNFRRGDMIYLYSYNKNEGPDIRKSILFKGVLKEIKSDKIVVFLNDGQQNPDIIGTDKDVFAVEHGASDVTTGNAIASLHQLITAPTRFKDLILGQRPPETDHRHNLTRSYDNKIDEILLRAKQAKDYFLLIGPPGTGKTSRAMRFLVEEELKARQSSLLLMSYTNRAVDEICGMLCEAELPFLRIGNEFSCDPRYRQYLLKEVMKDSPKLDILRQRLMQTRIIVGTTSTISSRPFIFDMKHFSLAIIDEASQILEPNLVGLLGMHRKTQQDISECCIDKFILIGDYKQLPAVVQQSVDESAVNDILLRAIGLTNCRISLFERLIKWERHEHRDTFLGILRRQGRMHPEIAEFPNREFYADEDLIPVPCEHQKEKKLYYLCQAPDEMDDLLMNHRMVFIPSPFCKGINISDKVNIEEAKIVVCLLHRIYHYYGEWFDADKSVGVIVPYRNQIAMIRKEVNRLNIEPLNHVSIDTVERYQGSQRDVIIYSFTIQNSYQLDFLTGNTFEEKGHLIDRKLNVAITRARKQMIMTGNENTLRMNPIFGNLIDFVKEKGGYKTNTMDKE